jgi:transposase
MIQLTPHMRILVAVESVDFRCGIDGLAKLAKERLRSDPFSGFVFVYRNRRRTSVKLLVYDGQGFWLCQKRLSSGKFQWWPGSTDGGTERLEAHQLQLLLYNGDPSLARGAPAWRPLSLPT